MSDRPEVLNRAAAWPALVAAGAILVLIPEAPQPGGAALGLLSLFLVAPALTGLALDGFLFRRGGLFGRLLTAVVLAATGVGMTAVRWDLPAGRLGFWTLGPILLALAGHGFGGLLGWRRARLLAALGLPSLALFLPFMTDAWLGSGSDPVTVRAGIDGLIRLSAWPGACAELLQLDLFKNASLYREFRLGEQLYSLAPAGDALRAQALLAAAVLLLGFVIRLSGRLLRLPLSRSRRCASIAQP